MINVREMGAVGNCETDDTLDFQAALTAAANKILYIPPGTYKLSAALTLADAGITIMGAGIGVSELRWTSGAATCGIHLSPDHSKQFIVVQDLRLVTAGTTGTALTIDCSHQIVDDGFGNMITWGPLPRVLIQACSIAGTSLIDSNNALGTAWATAIDLVAAVGATIRDCTICGLADTPWSPTVNTRGISIYGCPATGSPQNCHPVQYNIDNCSVWFYEFGVQFLNCEGCYVVNSNIVACNYGIYALSETDNHPQVCIANSHCNCAIRGILVDGMIAINISGCNIFIIQNATNGACIEVSGGGHSGAITCNTCISLSTGSNGIMISTYSYVAISNNIFYQQGTNMVTAIWLNANSANCKGAQNIFNGTFANNVLDQGTGNAVT